jgi:hypothetical protein
LCLENIVDKTNPSQRSKLTPLADAIAGNPQFSLVKQWFMQAVPKLSEYLTVPDTRTIDVRFSLVLDEPLTRVLGSSVSCHLESPPEEKAADDCDQIPAYLGHYPDNPPKPVKTAVRKSTRTHQQSVVKHGFLNIPYFDMTTVTEQVETKTTDAMFFPARCAHPGCSLFQSLTWL